MVRENRSSLAVLLVFLLLAMTAVSSPSSAAIAINVSVGVPPPALLIYAQPPIPGPGYLWTPGYWAWNGSAYYWVPGIWVLPPRVGLLWTPPWWGWVDGVYVWHAGYWGPHVGFYGGIDYGFGYSGHGYEGGYWNHGRFFYNRAVNNVRNVNITNAYYKAGSDRGVNRASFNGGHGGANAHPTRAEQTAAREAHIQSTVSRTRHINDAGSSRNLSASSNRGQPRVLASNVSSRHVNGSTNIRTAESRRNFAPTRSNESRTTSRLNGSERGDRPRNGGEQKGERGKRG